MYFSDRREAGKLLAKALKIYRQTDSIVYALPRGGIVVSDVIAKILLLPLDLLIVRKIGHPNSPEYAIAAVGENQCVIQTNEDINGKWLAIQIEKERKEIERRKNLYRKDRTIISPKNKIAIIVDDGIATGLTMKAAILEMQVKNPKKIVVATPIVTQLVYDTLKDDVDEIAALHIAKDNQFLGSVGAYYEHFPQLTDKDVIATLRQ